MVLLLSSLGMYIREQISIVHHYSLDCGNYLSVVPIGDITVFYHDHQNHSSNSTTK